MAASTGNDSMAELVVSSLPLETRFPPFQLRQHGGFWFPEPILPGIVAVRTRFTPRPSDVILASFRKSGTTWLKALAFATVHRADHPPRAPDHPLRRRNPHDCVGFLEVSYTLDPAADDAFAALPSPRPRVIGTHMPYSLLPERVKAEGAGCKVVYVCRDPKDAFVSTWLFAKKMAAAAAAGAASDDNEARPVPTPFGMEEAFELFCDGRCPAGPQWPHVSSYWEASRRWPEKVLFLRYEEMLRDPVGNVRKLAGFMGYPFSEEEEATGVVRDVVELCSIGVLKNVGTNKSGAQEYVKNEAFFRKGVAGDWSNHMTPAMAARLDGIVEDALQGSGFAFAANESS